MGFDIDPFSCPMCGAERTGVDSCANPACSMNKRASKGDKAVKSKRGFAALDPEKLRVIASKGGRAAHAKGTAHEWNTEEARRAGYRGGCNSHSGGAGYHKKGRR